MPEEEYVLVSAIEHYSYCPRQCGLIHLEDVFDDNVFTIRGRLAHERVDQPTTRAEKGVRVERALPIWSERHGLIGKADVVEFHPNGRILPVEYKSGKAKRIVHASLQLCAQALCLEEMFGTAIPRAALYFASERERIDVELGDSLRLQTLEAVRAIREMAENRLLPEPLADARCRNCSLLDACQPQLLQALRQTSQQLFHPEDTADLP